jgi:hypothetical protein
MIHIVIALSAASPLVMDNRLVRAARFWINTALRLTLGFAIATLTYFSVLFVVVETYKIGQPIGAVIYGTAFAVATLLAAGAGAIVSPARLSRIVILGVCALALLFPLGLYIWFGVTGSWRTLYLLYLLGSTTGGYAIARLTAGTHDVPRLCRI